MIERIFSFLFLSSVWILPSASGFAAPSRIPSCRVTSIRSLGLLSDSTLSFTVAQRDRHVGVFPQYASSNDDNNDEASFIYLSESNQAVLGAVGTTAALVVFLSEYVLKTTGCGLPAGPLGIFGLIEGLSYLSVVGLVALALTKKAKTGSGLPAGPGGILGAAEGLSFLAIAVGLIVLVLQVTNYGYIPNAVPMEGGMCS